MSRLLAILAKGLDNLAKPPLPFRSVGTWTQTEIDALRAAVASGVLTVRYEGPPARMITYQSLAEMRALLTSMVQNGPSGSGGPTSRLAAVSKGLG